MSEIFNNLMGYDKETTGEVWVLLKEAALHIAHLEAGLLKQRGEIDAYEQEVGPLRAKAALHDKHALQIEEKNTALFKAAERFRLTWENNDSRLKLALAEDDKERQSFYQHKVEMYAELLAECLAAATG